MQANDVKTIEDAIAIVEADKNSHVKVGLVDVDGVMRGKYMSKKKFLSALQKGFGFCDVVLGWDSNDQLYDNVSYTGWHSAYPDAQVEIIPDSCRILPFENNTLFFLAQFKGDAEQLCPRGVLRKTLQKAEDMGFAVNAAVEYEFFLFEETARSVREKQYRDLTNITPGFFGYSVLRSCVESDFYHELLDTCEKMQMPLEGLHTETGPGVLEAAIAVDSALAAADKAALFKTFTKVLAQKRDWIATFMAKWSDEYPGQSGHIHLSLNNLDGSSAFFDPEKTDGMSETMRYFVGGQRILMPELLSMVASTVNSYSRLIPGFWAPTASAWGIENRTTALRVIPGDAKSQRVEYRIAAADINPYLAMSAALASGLWGIENKVDPGEAIAGNAYEMEFEQQWQLPRTLMEAAGKLRKSEAAEELFGSDFVNHYAATREWEEREFRRAITDWEMQRYFEII